MKRDRYLEQWAAWLPAALAWLDQDPPNYRESEGTIPTPQRPALGIQRVDGPLRVALLSSSAAYDTATQAPYNESCVIGDSSWRAFPYDLPDDRIDFAHEHFDRAPARRDHELVLPRRALRAAGVETAAHVVTWSGYTMDWPSLLNQTIPQMVARVKADGANAALLVPV
ncbi:hypothetical protein EPN44_12480 [bacterium]|nr:MAG: hypothetical protein EPN44_12480 [bacterium]